jgi:hypothetical protein
MKDLQALKAEKQKKVDLLITNCGMFFAFSNQQFTENKTPLKDGKKFSIPVWENGIDEIEKWFKSEIKESNLREELIKNELNNYECFYTGDIEDALQSLGNDYTLEEVYDVYKKQLNEGVYDNW